MCEFPLGGRGAGQGHTGQRLRISEPSLKGALVRQCQRESWAPSCNVIYSQVENATGKSERQEHPLMGLPRSTFCSVEVLQN